MKFEVQFPLKIDSQSILVSFTPRVLLLIRKETQLKQDKLLRLLWCARHTLRSYLTNIRCDTLYEKSGLILC